MPILARIFASGKDMGRLNFPMRRLKYFGGPELSAFPPDASKLLLLGRGLPRSR